VRTYQQLLEETKTYLHMLFCSS